ncbi:MAG TPA: glutamate formimidoyltransferase [Chloroflexia bacterium]|nr:glutamate formimidoyltransferase [Chloroflexia bacterium]
MQKLVECVPNFSEGRRPEVIRQVVAAIEEAPGIRLLDVESNPDHNRSVVTFVGEPQAAAEAAFRLTEAAVRMLNMEEHTGEHPRIGAMDVVPFVPISGVSMDECVALARQVGQRIGTELQVPVYLYAQAASTPARRRLPDVRQGQYAGLKAAISTPERKPDFGPAQMHPSAGATAVGARPALIAFNVNLATRSISVARAIARGVRESSGGLVNVQAMGVELAEQGLVQVSMNLLDYTHTPIHRAFELVRIEAERHGVLIAGSEIVGLVPVDALLDAAGFYLRLGGFRREQTLELRLLEAQP